MPSEFQKVSRGVHPNGRVQPTIAEQSLLEWFRSEFQKRLEDPERIVTEGSALEFFEIEKKAAALNCGSAWMNPMTSRERWLAIGGYALGQRMLRAYRKSRGLPVNPPR